MGIFKGCFKAVGTVTLAATGTFSAILKGVSDTVGFEIGSQVFGAAKDASFKGMRGMWDSDSANETIDNVEGASYNVQNSARRQMADTAYQMAQTAKRNNDMNRYEYYMQKYNEFR